MVESKKSSAKAKAKVKSKVKAKAKVRVKSKQLPIDALSMDNIKELNLDFSDSLLGLFYSGQYAVGGNDSFSIDEDDCFWVILSGDVNLFEVTTIKGEVVSARHFMLNVSAGGAIFSLERKLLDDEENSYRQVIAVPNLDTKLYKGKLKELGGDANMFQTLSWIEDWVHKLDGALSKFFPPRPRSVLLEAEPSQHVGVDDWVCGHHNTIVWLRMSSGSATYGREDGFPFDASDIALPLSEASIIHCKEDCVFEGSFSVTEHVHDRLFDNLRHFNRFLMSALSHSLDEEAIRYSDQVVRLRSDTESKVSSALETIASVYSDREVTSHSKGGPLPSDIEVWCLALERLGIDAQRTKIASQLHEGEFDIFSIVSQCGARYRKIRILEDDWFKRDRGTFVSMTIRGQHPVALLPEGGTKYRMIDPDRGISKLVGLEESKSIATSGFMVYKPMPEKIEGWKDIVLFAFNDIMSDIKAILLIVFLIGLLSLFSPYFTGEILSNYLPANDLSLFSWALVGLALAAVSRILLGLANTFAMMRIIGNMTNTVQSSVWIKMLELPTSFYRRFTAGDLTDRANGINTIRETLTQSVFSTLLSIIPGTISLSLMVYYSWTMSIFAIFLLIFLVLATFFFTRMQLPHQRKAFMLQGEIEGFIYQVLSGISKIRLLNAENASLQKWSASFKKQKEHQYAAGMWNVIQTVFDGIVVPLMDLALFCFVLFVLLEGEQQPSFGIGDFLAFHVAFGQFSGAIISCASSLSTVIESVPLYERVRPVLEAEGEYKIRRPEMGTIRGKIQFSNVNFKYNADEALVLNRTSFTIKPGEYVALVGTSGSGKSTIVRLLLGFEKPNSGSILIDDTDINDVDIRSIRKQMRTVLQNSSIMQGSIHENIIAGRDHLTVDDIRIATDKAGLTADIDKLPMGLHTFIAEGGIGLSGGQRQRMLIARALIEPSSILVFDEATSALDNITQAVVQDSLKSVNSTRLVIAHRLSTVRDVDRILVIDKGKISEDGTYDELVRHGGLFAELVKRQTFKD